MSFSRLNLSARALHNASMGERNFISSKFFIRGQFRISSAYLASKSLSGSSLYSSVCPRFLHISSFSSSPNSQNNHNEKKPENDVGKNAPSSESTPASKGLWGFLKKSQANLKFLIQNFGIFAVASYLGVYLCTLSCVFAVTQLGFITGPDLFPFLNEKLLSFNFISKPLEVSPFVRKFVIAWGYTKLTEPFRVVATVVLIPILLRRLPHSVLRLLRVDPSKVESGLSSMLK